VDHILELFSFGPGGWGDELAAATGLTIRLAAATVPLGLLLGLLVALARHSPHRAYRFFGNTFATVFRGLPELLTIFLVYYGGQIVLQRIASLFTESNVTISPFLTGIVALGLVFAGYASETFLGAFRNIPKGLFEGAYALGLGKWQTLYLVILPSFVRLALPGIANLWLVLLKDTSLVSIIALDEVMRQTFVAVGATKEPFTFYLAACLIYLTLSLISSLGITAIERWSERGMRGAR